jgi:hypothetical protein
VSNQLLALKPDLEGLRRNLLREATPSRVFFVARRDPVQIRQLVRKTLEVCQPGEGYCLGLGNWVTDYIPPENYLAVLDEGRRFRLE